MQVKTLKPFYFPGQVVRGYAVLTAFNELKEKDLQMKVRGVEVPAGYGDEVKKTLKNK